MKGFMTCTEAPEVKCPKCELSFEPRKAPDYDDGHVYDEGSSLSCPSCDTQLLCAEVEVQRSWWWQVSASKETP